MLTKEEQKVVQDMPVGRDLDLACAVEVLGYKGTSDIPQFSRDPNSANLLITRLCDSVTNPDISLAIHVNHDFGCTKEMRYEATFFAFDNETRCRRGFSAHGIELPDAVTRAALMFIRNRKAMQAFLKEMEKRDKKEVKAYG